MWERDPGRLGVLDYRFDGTYRLPWPLQLAAGKENRPPRQGHA